MQIGNIVSDDLVQFVTLIICIIGAACWFVWGRGRIGYAIAPISFLLHRAIFYVVITVYPALDNSIVVMWSSAISLHSVITVATAAAMMLIIRRRGLRV